MNKHLFNNWDRWHPVTPFIGSKHLQLVCVGNEGPQALAQCPVSSCLFVNFGRQQAFSLYYFRVWNATSVLPEPFSAQNASFVCLVKTWWIYQVFTKFSPGFGIHQDFTRFCKFTRIPSVFTKTWSKFNQLTKFSPSCLQESPGFHQVTKFWNSSPGFHQNKKNGEFTKFWF